MENLDRPSGGGVPSSNHIHTSSSQNRRTSTESGQNQTHPDSGKPVKKRSVDETGRKKSSSSSKSESSPQAPSGHRTRTSETRSSENRRSRTEGLEQQQQQQQPSSISSSGPSAARSSAVLQSTINPLLTDLSRRYSQMQRMASAADPSAANRSNAAGNVDAIDELRNAFELAERSSPGITELFTHLILTRLQQPGNVAEDRARVAVERLARSSSN